MNAQEALKKIQAQEALEQVLQNEDRFQQWYKKHAQKLGLHPDPDFIEHFYDYRRAFQEGAEPDKTGHWPSKYKLEGHPNLIINGVDTRNNVEALSAQDALNQIRFEDKAASMPYQLEGRGIGLYETPERFLQPGFPYAKRPGLYELPEPITPTKPTQAFGPQLPQKQATLPSMPFSLITPEQAETIPAALIGTGRVASKAIPPLHAFIEKSIAEMPAGFKKELLEKHPIAEKVVGGFAGEAGKYAAAIYAADAVGLFNIGPAVTGKLIGKGVSEGIASFIGGGMPGGIIFSTMKELDNLSDVMTGKKQATKETLLYDPVKSYAFGHMLFGGYVAGGAKTAMGLGGGAFGARTLAPYVEKMWRGEKPEWKNLAVEMPVSVALGMLIGYWGHESTAKAYMAAVKDNMIERSADFIQSNADIINKDPASFMFATKYQGKPVGWGLDEQSQRIIELGQANLHNRNDAVNLARATVDHFFAHPSPTVKADFSQMSDIIRTSPELISNMTADIEKGLSPTSALIKETFKKVMDVPLHPAQAGREALAEIEAFLEMQNKAPSIEKSLDIFRKNILPVTEKAQELKKWIDTHEDIPLHPAEAAREEMRIAELKFDMQQEMEKNFINKIPWEEYTNGLTRQEQSELAKINKQLEKLAEVPKSEKIKQPFLKPKEPSRFQQYLKEVEHIKNKKVEPVKPLATNEQKTLGHNLQRKHGLSIEAFKRLKVELTGVESMADMDKDQAQAIIDALSETKEKPKILLKRPEPKYKEPTLAQWPTSKYTYAQVLGLEPMMKDMFIAEIERTLESAKIDKFADEVTKQLNKQALLGDRLASKIKNKPTKPVAWMRDLLNTYGDVEELPPIDAKNKEIFRQIRDLFRNLLKRENEVRANLGREPINNVNAYVPLLFDQITKEILRQVGLLAIEPDPLKRVADLDVPDDVKEWLRPRMPKKPFNPTEFVRQHREEMEKYFSKDLNRLIKWIGHYATREIWLSEPLEIFKGELEQAADTGELPEATKDWAEAVVKFDIFKQPTASEKAARALLQPGIDLVNKVLHPLNRHLSNPINQLSYATRKVVMTSALAGRPKMPIRNLFQRGLLLNLYPAKHFVKAQLGMGVPNEIKQQLKDTWFYRMSKRFEDYPELKHKITEWAMAPYQLSHAGLWLGKIPVSNVDVAMATGWRAGEELRTNPRYIKWAKNLAKKRGLPEETYLRTPQDSIEEAIRAAFLTQWMYHPLFMPQFFRGQIGRGFASLTSWQQFLHFTHNRELFHVLFKGESYQGKPYPPYYRMRSFLGYATFIGILEGLRASTGLDMTRFYLGPSITVLNPMGRLMLGAVLFATAGNNYDRNYGKWLLTSSWKIFVPYGIGASEWQRWLTGELSTKEFLTFQEKNKKANLFK